MQFNQTPEYRSLQDHYDKVGRHLDMRKLFADDQERSEKMCISVPLSHGEAVYFDYSKHLVTDETMTLLVNAAKAAGLVERRNAMFRGERINVSENRAVLHVALRGRSEEFNFDVDGQNVGEAVKAELSKMFRIAEAVRSGEWRGWTGQRIKCIVNIGIGGSDLGPAMACLALSDNNDPVSTHFVSNIDSDQLGRVLNAVNPQETLFIIVSKTFTTQETLRNAESAKAWFLKSGASESAVSKHFIAVSTNSSKVSAFGIDLEGGMVGFWDWVGGRYSVWSAVGLSLCIATGPEAFSEFLEGGRCIDQHFLTAPLESNVPALMGLLGVWYTDFKLCQSHAVLPYEQSLARLPAYLQQLEMESNGKSVTRNGQVIGLPTCPIVWGEPGTNGQHAFYQLLHQGTVLVPCDFLIAKQPRRNLADADMGYLHHKMLQANCLAQSKALMIGRPEASDPNKRFSGNRPSTTIVYPRLTPRVLGALIALYEHKAFAQGTLWGINSFDQFGVELGKEMAGELLGVLSGDMKKASELDGSTRNLIKVLQQ